MADPEDAGQSPGRARNFTMFQLIVFLGAGLTGLAALLSAGLALGLAVAGAGVLAVLVLAVWLIVANVVGGERDGSRDPPAD